MVKTMQDYLDWVQIMFDGLVVTVYLTIISAAISVILATVASVLSISRSTRLAFIGRNYIDIIRSVPILVALIFGYFAIGSIAKNVSAFWVAGFVLGISMSAYLGDVFRGALLSVPVKQWEAGESLGMTWFTALRTVIAPQLLRPSAPIVMNMIVSTVKNSALASLITLQELTLSGTLIASQNFRTLEVYVILAAMYLALLIPLSFFSDQLERRFVRNA